MKGIVIAIALLMSFTYSVGQISFGFQQFTYGTLANNARDLASGDLNGDGKLDIVMADFASGNVVVVLGAGDGTFGAAQAYPVVVGFTSQPNGVELGDFNNDGKLDVAVTTRRYQRLSIMLGDGTGLLGAPTHYFIDWMTGVLLFGRGSALADVVKGDFNGDSFLDLIVTDEFFQIGQIFLGTGIGTFTPGVRFSTGNPNFTAIAADFNNDGKLDLAVSESAIIGTGAVSIFIGRGDGTFNPRTTFPTSNKLYTSSLAAADFNGDGNIDIAATNSGANILGQVGDVSILLGNGTGSFGAATNYTTGVYPSDVVVSDINLDGKLDLVVHHDGFDPGVGTPAGTGNISVLEGNSTGTFALSTSVIGASSGLVDRVITGDFNNDARPDIASSGNLNILVINLNTTPCVSALPSPVIASFTPTSGIPGTTVTINGSNFSSTPGDNNVKFNGVNSTVLTSNATSITAKVPLSATSGAISIAIGCNVVTSSSNFIVTPPAPTITSFTPSSGKVGTAISIDGTNFNLTTAVSFGGIAATSFSVVSPTRITAVVGVGASGSVALTTPAGSASLNGFTFIPPPTITSFTPTSSASGATITITGTNFTGATVVTFGATSATAFNVLSPTSITAVLGTGSSGSVAVTTPGGTASLVGFTYIPPPAITSFSPTFGPVGTSVSIIGEGFDPIAGNNIVKFNGVDAVVTASTTTSISTLVPTGATTGSISVTVGSLSATSSTSFVITTNPTGPPPEFTWVKQATGTGSQSSLVYGNRIARDNSNNQYVTGGVFGTSTIGTFDLVSNGQLDVFVAKYNSDGDVLWATREGGTGNEVASAIATDDFGNVYVTGSFRGPATFGSFIPVSSTIFDYLFILKYSSDGTLLWAKQTTGRSSSSDIDTDASGNVYITGQFFGSVIFGGVTLVGSTTNSDIFTAKYDPNGNLMWAKKAGGNNSNGDYSYGISTTPSGESYIIGDFYGTAFFDAISLSNSAESDFFIAKYDASGNVVWAKAGGESLSGFGNSIAIDNAGDVYATGTFLGQIGSSFTFGGISFTVRGGVRETYLLKLDPSGNVLWGTQSIGGGSENVNCLAIDGNKNLYLSGYFSGEGNFGGTALSNAGGSDFFMAKYSENGIFQWAFSEGGAGIDYSNGIEIGTNGEIFMAGIFSDSPTYGTFPLFSTPSISRLFVARLGPCNPANAPSIIAFSPSSATVGTTVTITGTNFSTNPASNNIKFNGVTASVAVSTATSITTTVPVGATTGPIEVTVGCNTVTSAGNFTITVPGTITISPQPTSSTICEGTTVSFSIAASGTTNIAYQWQKFNGSVFTDVVNSGGYSGVTSTTIDINTTSNFGAGDYRCKVSGDLIPDVFSNTVTLTINPIPSSPTLPVNGNRCEAGTVNLSVSGGTNGQYRWYTSATGGTPISGELTDTYTTPALNSTTTYYVSIDNGTCESTRTPVTATINAIPSAPSSPVNGSSCGPGIMTVSVSGGTNGQYRWYTASTGGTAIAGEFNSLYTTPSLSTNTTYYAALNINGCESATRTAVDATINITPSAPIATGTTICSNTSATLNASGGTDGQYRWYSVATGGTAIVGEFNSTYLTPNQTANTTYYVALNILSCESPRSPVTVTVNPLPTAPAITSTKAPVNSTVILCTENNESTTLATSPAGFASYAWSNGQTVASFSTNQSGNITVQVTDGNGCQSVPSAALIINNTSCKPSIATTTFSTSVGGTVSKSILSLITLVGTLDPASFKVVQQPASGAVASIDPMGILTVNYSGIQFIGNETVTIEVCDTNIICATQDLTIEVEGDIVVYNALSPNGDGKNEEFILENIEVIPKTQSNKVLIYNRWGDLVWEAENYDNIKQVFTGLTNNGKELPTGTYYYKIEFASDQKSLSGFISLKR
jgi:gliding motility-associated-like protein